MDLHYGHVTSVERADMSSGKPKGAMVGGMTGMAYASHRNNHKTKAALEGAVAGAIIGALIDRHRKKTHMYSIDLVDGGSMRVIIEDTGIRVGDCVSVEDGRHTNVRRVSEAYCEQSAVPDRFMIGRSHSEASECRLAKDELLDARDERQASLAERKVRVFCH
jgi:outer membrane lipoprotein SlyB